MVCFRLKKNRIGGSKRVQNVLKVTAKYGGAREMVFFSFKKYSLKLERRRFSCLTLIFFTASLIRLYLRIFYF